MKMRRCPVCNVKTNISTTLTCKFCNNLYCIKCISPDFHNCSKKDNYMKLKYETYSNNVMHEKCVSDKIKNRI